MKYYKNKIMKFDKSLVKLLKPEKNNKYNKYWHCEYIYHPGEMGWIYISYLEELTPEEKIKLL